ncbi:MAG: PHP domain-containing protein [Parcubacteria group bacterium]
MESKYQVLHCHTVFSDGTMSHREVLDICPKYNIGTVAFTDHDILMSDEVFDDLKSLNHPVKFISGVEITATVTQEIKENIVSLHIIGLFVDHKNEALSKFCRVALEIRRERMNMMVDNFKQLGFFITREEVKKESAEGVVGKPHLVRALLKNEANHKIIEDFMKKLKERGKEDPSLKARYEEVIQYSLWQRTFNLFLGNDPIVPNAYTPRSWVVTLDEAVTLIRGAGGIAVLAHPYVYKDKLGLEWIEKLAREGRIDGIETVPSFGENSSLLATTDQLEGYRAINRMYGLVAGGGGDYHRPEDYEITGVHTVELEETKGFLSRIFEKYPQYRNNVY